MAKDPAGRYASSQTILISLKYSKTKKTMVSDICCVFFEPFRHQMLKLLALPESQSQTLSEMNSVAQLKLTLMALLHFSSLLDNP
jgi:hypothetical protein